MIYSILFVLAGWTTFAAQFYLGIKRKIPSLPLALALTGSLLMFMISMKIPFLGLGLSESEIASVRYMMTGGLGTALALVAARYVLRITFERLDDAALVFPLAVALTKVGCFFAGCCFGIQGAETLGVTYADFTPAHVFYMQDGHPDHSPLLHPVQLYEAAGALVIFVAMIFLRRRWRQPGSALFFLIAAYLPLRFMTEFFRASDTVILLNGLKVVQWVSIPLWIVALALLRRNEKMSFFVKQTATENPTLLATYFAIEVVLFITFFNYLHFVERAVILAALLFSGGVFLLQARRWSGQLHRALVAPAVVAIIMISTAQVSQDSVAYKSLRLGFSGGQYVNTYRDGDGCDALTRDYKQQYTMLGVGFSSFIKRGTRSSELGVSVFGGSQDEFPLNTTTSTPAHFGVLGAHGYGKYDTKWIGIGAGMNIGNLRYAEDRKVSPLGKIGYFTTPVLPSFYARVGPRRFLYVQYNFADAFPASTPGYMHQFSLGSGFGAKNGFAISIGTFGHFATFVNVTLPMRQFGLDVNYGFGQAQNEQVRQLSLSLKYHLPSTVKKPGPPRNPQGVRSKN